MSKIEATENGSDKSVKRFEILADGRPVLLVTIRPEDDDHDPWSCSLQAPGGRPIDGRGDEPLVAFADAHFVWDDVLPTPPMPWEEIEAALERVGAFEDPRARWSGHVRL